MLPDLRYALRALLRSPGFTLVAVLSLALGIGANTAIFSMIDAVMLRTLPVPEPEELVQVTDGGPGEALFTNPIWEELRNRGQIFESAFAYTEQEFDLATGGEVRPASGSYVSGGFFPTLGVSAAAGRLLGPGDDQPGCPPVAVLSHGFWQSEYGGDPAVVGSALSLNGVTFQVIGVAAAGFSGFDVGTATRLFAPLCSKALLEPPSGGLDNHSAWFLRIVGRLPEGMTPEQTRARIRAVAPSIFAATVSPEWGADMRRGYLQNTLGLERAATGYSALRGEFDRGLLAMMLVVGIVLLIACANVANLLLARATARRREIAIRFAVGAARGRIVRQLLTESVLLASVGAAVGLLVAVWLNGVLMGLVSGAMNDFWLDLTLNTRVLGFTALVALATAVLFGLAPAWRATRVQPETALRASGRTIAEGQSRFGLGKILVVSQIALSLLLLVAAGLLLGSFRKLVTMDPGFQSEGLLLASVSLRNAGYADDELPFVKRDLLDRLRASPAVVAASASDIVPISGAGWNGEVEVEEYTPTSERDGLAFYNAVTEDFFRTLGTPVIAGREFTVADRSGAPLVAMINESFARKFFADRSPLGEQIRVALGSPQATDHARVVGVVRDAKYSSLREAPRQVVYLSQAQAGAGRPGLDVQLRGSGGAEALIPVLTRVTAELNPRIAIQFRTMEDQLGVSLLGDRLMATLSASFGALALLLAVVGLYGTIAYSVSRRRNEIGVRLALGAARGDLVRMILREAGVLVGSGLFIGVVAALLASRVLASFLYGVSPTDPAILGAAAVTLTLVALTAGALPAWRAARLDPVAALREE